MHACIYTEKYNTPPPTSPNKIRVMSVPPVNCNAKFFSNMPAFKGVLNHFQVITE